MGGKEYLSIYTYSPRAREVRKPSSGGACSTQASESVRRSQQCTRPLCDFFCFCLFV